MRQLPLNVIVCKESAEIKTDNNYKFDTCGGEEIGRTKPGG